MPQRIYSEDYRFSKYGLYGQPCHRGFTAKITNAPNMVCTVNHAMKDLQHRILDYSKYCSLHCHMQMEREERLRRWREQYRARRESEKQKSNGNPGWQDEDDG